MKKAILTSTFTLVIILFGNAQENIIKVNPVGLAFGIANATYEFCLDQNQSISISGTYYRNKVLSQKIMGYGVNAGYNLYFLSQKDAPEGFHIGPNAGVLFMSNNISKATAVTIGATTGHQWVFGDHFSLDVFGAFDYFTTTTFPGVDGTNFGVGISIGYAW